MGVKFSMHVAIVFAGSLALAGVIGQLGDARKWRAFERLQPGMTDTEAVEVMGRPLTYARCGTAFTSPHRPDCMFEMRYASAFANFRPLYWRVQVDRSGRVVAKDLVTQCRFCWLTDGSSDDQAAS